MDMELWLKSSHYVCQICILRVQKFLGLIFVSLLIIFHGLWNKIFWNFWWKFFSLFVRITFCVSVRNLRRSTYQFEKNIQRTVFLKNWATKSWIWFFRKKLSSALWEFQSFEPEDIFSKLSKNVWKNIRCVGLKCILPVQSNILRKLISFDKMNFRIRIVEFQQKKNPDFSQKISQHVLQGWFVDSACPDKCVEEVKFFWWKKLCRIFEQEFSGFLAKTFSKSRQNCILREHMKILVKNLLFH